jgi:hypothetical protein
MIASAGQRLGPIVAVLLGVVALWYLAALALNAPRRTKWRAPC